MKNIYVRQANPSDLKDLVSLLSQLTQVGEVENIETSVYDNIYLCISGDKIIACATLLVESKIIHGGSKIGHIEDVVVDRNYRGNGIGKYLITHLTGIANELGCYKVILDCNIANTGFYESCGFRKSGVCMRYDLN